jgi:hypothetical protein
MGVGLTSKTYFGKFVKGRKQVVVRSDMTTSPLRCRDFFTPSFAWGYHGGAPDNLAIAILQDHFGLTGATVDARVLCLFSAFADEMVSNFGSDEAWSLTAGRIARWVTEHEQAHPRSMTLQPRSTELQPELQSQSTEPPVSSTSQSFDTTLFEEPLAAVDL